MKRLAAALLACFIATAAYGQDSDRIRCRVSEKGAIGMLCPAQNDRLFAGFFARMPVWLHPDVFRNNRWPSGLKVDDWLSCKREKDGRTDDCVPDPDS